MFFKRRSAQAEGPVLNLYASLVLLLAGVQHATLSCDAPSLSNALTPPPPTCLLRPRLSRALDPLPLLLRLQDPQLLQVNTHHESHQRFVLKQFWRHV